MPDFGAACMKIAHINWAADVSFWRTTVGVPMRNIVLALTASIASAPLIAQVAVPSSGAQQTLPGLMPPAAEADAPISAADARDTAADFARMLEANYVFPDLARKYAERVRNGAARGEYDDVGSRGALAAALTRDVRAVHFDGHLRIWPQTAAAGASPMMTVVPQAQQGAVKPATPGPGHAIEEARWLAPGVAYIRFTLFPLDPAVTAAAAKFMKDHADAKTVIFDLRTHRGGGMGQVAAMLPYLFDKETVFLSQGTRASTGEGPTMPAWARPASSSAEGVRTTEIFATPHPSERRMFDAKVHVLTSSYTVSAGEAFAFGLKTTGRASLIGEITTGAGHYAPPGQRVNENFGAFVPIGRAFDPRTGRGWEGTGVEPDIPVSAGKALVEALVRSGIAPDEAEKLSASVHPQGPMRREKLSRAAASHE